MAERDWFIGTLEVGEVSVPIIARGKSREEAEKRARRDILMFQIERLKHEQQARSDASELVTKVDWR